MAAARLQSTHRQTDVERGNAFEHCCVQHILTHGRVKLSRLDFACTFASSSLATSRFFAFSHSDDSSSPPLDAPNSKQ
jgi:hypothetical protein